MKTTALYFYPDRSLELREETLPQPDSGQIVVRAEYSAISAGTEMLIYRGQLPENIETDAGIPSLVGKLEYPLKYGYAVVGEIIKVGKSVSPKYRGKKVFLFHPHQSLCITELEEWQLIPPDISEKDALFFANMETAVSLAMDGRPVIGENGVVFGLGVVGLLTTAVLSRFPLGKLIGVDPSRVRREFARKLGAHLTLDPTGKDFHQQLAKFLDENDISSPAAGSADLIYELSGWPGALDMAIRCAGYDSRVMVGSWFGNQPVNLDLGTHFHRNHVQLISSQVSTLHPRWRGRWSKHRRYQQVWKMIREIKPSGLVTHQFPLVNAYAAYKLLDEHPQNCAQVILTYQNF